MTKKHIYIFSISGAVRDIEGFNRGIKFLESLGLNVEIDNSALISFQRFAGDDKNRINVIYRAINSRADIILLTRGGYGINRILNKLPFKDIVELINHNDAKFIGFSDFTAFNNSVLAQTGKVTWSGPNLITDFGNLENSELVVNNFKHLFIKGRKNIEFNLINSLEENNNELDVEGIIWGGNLTVLNSLIGTKYFPKIDDGILFLEDTGEELYKVERMLIQLLNSENLKNQKAILFGQFTEYKLTNHDNGFNFDEIIKWLRKKIKTPIITGVPIGHIKDKIALPVGANINLKINNSFCQIFIK